MRIALIFVACIALWSCSKTSDTISLGDTVDGFAAVDTNYSAQVIDTTGFDYESYFRLESYLTKEKIDDDKFETVDFDCAILIYPTPEQIDKMKQEEGEEDFYIAADDGNWYQAEAISTIDSVGIKTIVATGQFLKLKGKQETWDLDIRKENLPAWNLIFFKTTKAPEIISTVGLTVDAVKEYFEE